MAASGIGDFNLILGAEINPSVSQLKADIKTIAERLSKSPLKITIGANVSKSAPQIRADFAKISARLSKNPPRVTIGASVAPSTRQIKTDLNAIVEKINKNPPKVKLGATASGQKNTGSSASQSTTSSSNTKTLTAETTEYYNALTRVNTLLTQVTSMQQNWTAARNGNASGAYGNLNGYASELQALIQKLETGSMSADEFKNSFARISSNVSAARTAIKSAGEAMRETTAAQAGQTAQTKLLTATSTEYHTALKQIDTLLAQVTNAQTRWTAAKTGKSRNEYNNLNTYANILQRLREEVVTLASADARAGMEQDAFNKRMAAARAGVTSATTSIRNAGEATQSWGDRIGSLSAKFGTWFSITRVIMAGVRVIKQMVSNVVELDTAMTELKKVTEESDSTYEKFLTKATNRAKELGAALTDVVSATADFARLGFNLDDSAQLADAAIVYKNVGDGIEDIGDASESIISTMQAFGVEADDVMSIVDKFNEVGNNYAISSKGVGDALLRSASAMKAAGNSLDETIALAAAANTVVQDPEKVGTALKTLSMYLRAAKTEAEDAGESTEGMANSVSELREELLSLTGNKVDIQLDENTFKSTYQIMQELSTVWHELTDVSQANILELIGGKRNSNVVAALLENFSVANNAVKTSAESAGSAWRENLKVLDSIILRNCLKL